MDFGKSEQTQQKWNMRIEIDNKSGFCFGVVEAVRRAEESLQERDKLFCLGDIVHNNTEVERLSQRGLVTISHAEFFTMKNTTVLLRAHGEPPAVYEYARANNIKLIDATCPVVLKLQQRIRESYEANGNSQVVIYGKIGHAEVNGLVGQTGGNAIVVERTEDINKIDFSRPIELYSQTTKGLDGFHSVAEALKKKAFEVPLKVHDTVCRQVANRIPGIRVFAAKYDLILFVSGIKSSNGQMLFEISKSVNPNSKFISSVGEIDFEWFNGIESVGICGATSTPKHLLEEVAAYVSKLNID
jgi:4-hydroxy-3-methylbut-2-enyl diphosphate reductase